MKTILLFVLLSGQFVVAMGQINVTASDLGVLGGTADSTWNYSSTDSSGLSALIADSGADRTWDISNRAFQMAEGTVARYAAFPDGAPDATDSAFTSCNLVESLGDTSSGLTWLYYRLDDSGFYSFGSVTAGVKSTFVPAYSSYKFPLTYGSQWGGKYKATITYNSNQSITSSVTYNDRVDGWGTIITPEGSFPCLRLRNSSVTTGSGNTITTVDYFFIGKNRAYASIASSFGSNVVSYSRSEALTGIKMERPSQPSSFTLFQNFPNPFNPSTTISYRLPRNSLVVLKVFDVLGREVETLVNERESVGSHAIIFNAANLPSGVYFYRLEAGTYHDTKTLLLLK